MNRRLLIAAALPILMLLSCSKKSGGDDLTAYNLAINPSQTHQEMIGFGGALTWYADRVISSPNKTTICNYLFNDLGADIIRLKNWYYPLNYPSDKSADQMVTSGMKTMFDVTNQLYNLAKQSDPSVKVLLSSWGPPASLKSNGLLNNGTLAKDANGFVYAAFADYWMDILDHITFRPDYISIQNEPSWGTDGWESCVWRPTETAAYPGYENAFDSVHVRLAKRTSPPEMTGPEAENIGASSFGGNTFGAFSDVIKDKPYLSIYSYHTYNFNASTYLGDTESPLEMIKSDYGNKPNIMTEYSGMPWLKTAQFILKDLNLADASGYIYWEMVWGEDGTNAMIKIDNAGSYYLTPFYFVMKHFAKNVDAGYHRIDAELTSSVFDCSAFINTAGKKITYIVVNPTDTEVKINLSVTGRTITSVSGVQSAEGSFYSDMGTLNPGDPLRLKANSLSTFVINIE